MTKINRSSVSGKFVTKKYAAKHKKTTETETVNEYTDLKEVRKKLLALFNDDRNHINHWKTMITDVVIDIKKITPKIMRLFVRALGPNPKKQRRGR